MIERLIGDDWELHQKAVRQLVEQYGEFLASLVGDDRERLLNYYELGDLVNGFISEFVRRESLRNFDRNRRFRYYMQEAFRRYRLKQWRKLKMKHHFEVVIERPEDLVSGEESACALPMDYKRAYEMFGAALEFVASEIKKNGDDPGDPFRFLVAEIELFVPGGSYEGTYAEIGEKFDKSGKWVKTNVHRIRKKIREHLEIVVCSHLGSEENLEEELDGICELLSIDPDWFTL